jgi:protein-S-isoprenylcysteine O-methyltransferase Ste14
MLFVYSTLLPWVVMILYWVITAKTNGQSSLKSELIPLLKLIGSALITYLPLITGGWFSGRFYGNNPWTNIMGVLLCASGISVAIWARHTLGKNWSGRVMVQQGHHLAEEGPYRVIRHPIYSGALLAMMGASLVLGYVFSFAYLALSAFGLVRKSKQEEGLLISQFPIQYAQYRKRTKMLIPYVL